MYITVLNPILGVFTLLGYLFGRYCDPDWDIMGTSDSEGRMVNELKVIGYFIYGISSAYGAIFRRFHRSFITHFPIISTGIRLIFLFWWIYLFYYFGYTNLQVWHLEIMSGIWLGLSCADFVHSLADFIWHDDGKHFKDEEKRRAK